MESIIIIGILIFSPSAYEFYGEIPENIPTFKIKFSREQTELFGALRVQEDWIKETSPIDLKTKAVEIVVDTPWEQPQPRRRELGQKLEISYEAPALRKKRLEDGWRKAGFTIIDTGQSKKAITTVEYKNAIDTIMKANELYSITKEPQLYYSPMGKEIPLEERGKLLIRLWWLHLVILAIGGTSLYIVVWVFLRK